MTTTTVEREELHHLIQRIPNEKIPAVLLLVRDFCGEEHEPNEETVAAMIEADELARLYGAHLSSTDCQSRLMNNGGFSSCRKRLSTF